MTETNRNTSPLFDAETERLIRQLTGDEYSAQIWDAENALRARIRAMIEEARVDAAQSVVARARAGGV